MPTTYAVSAVATYSDLAAFPVGSSVVNQIVYLEEALRAGFFRCVNGSPPLADPQGGLFVVSTYSSSYYWERQWDGIEGRPEWFGAVPNNASVNCATAITACYSLCPVTALSDADYWIQSTIYFASSYKTVRGVGVKSAGQGLGTRIVLNDPPAGSGLPAVKSKAHILVVGNPNQPSPYYSDNFITEVHLSGFTLIRDSVFDSSGASSLANYPSGLRVNFVTRCTFRELTSTQNGLGFYVEAAVLTKFDDCLAETIGVPAGSSSDPPDYVVGYYLDGHQVFSPRSGSVLYSGGNASIYITRCTAAGSNVRQLHPYGLRARGAFADTFVSDFECAGIENGIELAVDNVAGTQAVKPQQIDVHIITPKIDGCSGFGIEINLGTATAGVTNVSIDIVDPYILAPLPSGMGDKGIVVYNGAGLVTLTGGQIHYNFQNGSIHLSNTRGVTIQGVKVHEGFKPVVLNSVSNVDCRPQIINNDFSTAAALECLNISRCLLKPTIIGSDSMVGVGVSLDANCRYGEVNGSLIDPGCISGTSVADKVAAKVQFSGFDARSSSSGFSSTGHNVLTGVTE